MLNKKLEVMNWLFNGLFFLLIGITLLLVKHDASHTVLNFIALGIIVISCSNIILNLMKKNIDSIIKQFLNVILGITLILLNELFTAALIIAFGFYLLFHGLIHFINYILYVKNQINGKFKVFMQFFICFVLSLAMIFNPNQNINYFELISGIYFILLGTNYLVDYLRETIPNKFQDNVKKRIRIALPNFITVLIPQAVINYLNNHLKIDRNTVLESTKNTKPDLEVIFHLAENGSAKFGHAEISYKGKTYSYGNYDNHSRELFDAIGDGVIAIANTEKYIKYAVTKKNRYIVTFGIKLTDKQEQKVKEKINKLINENTIDWYPDLQKYEMGLIKKDKFTDMSSDLYKLADCKYKKIIKGRSKKFFVLKNNCVMIAESILKNSGLELLEINGLISPGAYLENFNRLFLQTNSNVISRKVYTKYDYINK